MKRVRRGLGIYGNRLMDLMDTVELTLVSFGLSDLGFSLDTLCRRFDTAPE
jgi:hypothetical protein